jgi:hypothetical protein
MCHGAVHSRPAEHVACEFAFVALGEHFQEPPSKIQVHLGVRHVHSLPYVGIVTEIIFLPFHAVESQPTGTIKQA